MDNSKILEYNFDVQESLDMIFAGILVGGIDTSDTDLVARKREVIKANIPRFDSTFTNNIFFEEYALIYDVAKKVKSPVFTVNQVNTIIDNNTDLVLDSPFIDINKYNFSVADTVVSDEEKVEAFKSKVQELIVRLSNVYVSEDEFEVACNTYIDVYKDFLMQDVANEMSRIMATGIEERLPNRRRRTLKGREDAQMYYEEKMEIIRALEEDTVTHSYIVDDKWLDDQLEKTDEQLEDAITDFGIKEIDEKVGMLRRGNMIEFMGPPKGGKTTAAAYLGERCLSQGFNVAVWPLEGEADEWEAMFEALIIRRFEKDPMKLDKKNILERRYHSDAERQSVISAKTILATDPTRGRLSFISGSAYVEDYRTVLDNHYKRCNPFDVLIIDSPINFMSRKGKAKPQAISEAYMGIKDYVSHKMNRKALCIVTAQLKQDIVDFLRKNPSETIDVTAGGESAETIRTPDEVIGLFSTKNERSLGQMKVYDVASRHHETFDDLYIGCELGCAYFYSKPELNE